MTHVDTLGVVVADDDELSVRAMHNHSPVIEYRIGVGNNVSFYLSPGQARLLMALLGTALSLEFAQQRVADPVYESVIAKVRGSQFTSLDQVADAVHDDGDVA